MEFLNSLPLVGGTLGVIIPFLFVLSIVVFVHEYGHYIVARWCGVKSDVFSIGFGPELLGWNDKRGMRWKISAIPLGGYVKFRGDLNPASAGDFDAISKMSDAERKEAFHTTDLWRRTLIVLAGPVFNFILSIIIFAALGMYFGARDERPEIDQIIAGSAADMAGLKSNDRIISVNGNSVESYSDFIQTVYSEERTDHQVTYLRGGVSNTASLSSIMPALIDTVAPGSAADKAGLLPGDRITAVDGVSVNGFNTLNREIIKSEGEITLTVTRNGSQLDIAVTPQMIMRRHPDTGKDEILPTLGVTNSTGIGAVPFVRSVGIIEGTGIGISRTYEVLAQSLAFVRDLVVGKADTTQLGGPIGIAQVSGQAASLGLPSLLGLIALISASIGLINLFPIPVLDGGHLVFFGLEALRGKPLGERASEISMGFGMGLVLLLMIFATYNDLIR